MKQKKISICWELEKHLIVFSLSLSADILEAGSVVSNILCFRLICTVTYKLHMFMTGDTASYKLYM